MKALRGFCTSSVLILLLTVPAFAGEIETTIAPPPTLAGEIHTTVTGQIDMPSAGEIETGSNAPSTGDSVTAAALGLIQSLLVLF